MLHARNSHNQGISEYKDCYIPRSYTLKKYDLLSARHYGPHDYFGQAVSSTICTLALVPGIWVASLTVPEIFRAYTDSGTLGFTILSALSVAWTGLFGYGAVSDGRAAYKKIRTKRSRVAVEVFDRHLSDDIRWKALKSYFYWRQENGLAEIKHTWYRILSELETHTPLSERLDEILATYLSRTRELAVYYGQARGEEKVDVAGKLCMIIRRTARKLLFVIDEHDAPAAHEAYAKMVDCAEQEPVIQEMSAFIGTSKRLILSQNIRMTLEDTDDLIAHATHN